MMEFESIQQPPSYKIQIVETPTPSVAYTTDRDKIWKERVEEGKK